MLPTVLSQVNPKALSDPMLKPGSFIFHVGQTPCGGSGVLRLVEQAQKQRLETAADGSNVSTNPVQKSKIHNGPK